MNMPQTAASKTPASRLLSIAIAAVWLINGLFCKVLNLVPRHQAIVARILGDDHALIATKLIGVFEIAMFIWILSGIRSRWCALIQIGLIATMNTLEFILAPDLLLFGRINSIVACIFIGIIFYHEFLTGNRKNNHPFAVEAFFNTSLVLTYAVPKEEFADSIPACLRLDLLHDKWAFIAAAFVDTRQLRPKGFPKFLGNDFFLIGFRIFVRYQNNDGKSLRGLYILKSETNKAKMSRLGNIFTRYNYSTTDIHYHKDQEKIEISSGQSGIAIEAFIKKDAPLPASSPFKDWKEARRFAGPLPFTFSYDNKTKEVLIIEGVREHWEPSPVQVTKSSIRFIEQKNIPGILLANAFSIENVPYSWKKGKMEIWKG